ncbi:MAG: amidohydrolase family protein [Planctomycetes bacterium]|nr:amidohydrolase family protein [Planctomycetota bacterium]
MIRRSDLLKSRTVGLLHEAGARLLLGTDSANPYVIAGWSAHEELALLVEAGLTPREALLCATRNAGLYLGEPLGTIEAGAYADLLVVEGDPTVDVRNTTRIAGVVTRGRWLGKEELGERLEAVRASYATPRDRFAGLPALPEGIVHRYTITWNGLLVGEERFVRLEEGTIHAQSVNDPPQGETLAVTIEPNGSYRLERRGSGGEVMHFRGEEGGAALMAFWAYLRPRLGDGAFDWNEFSAEEATRIVKVRIDATEEKARRFALSTTRPDGTFRSRLTFDGEGIPVELVTELQQGTVVIRRVN